MGYTFVVPDQVEAFTSYTLFALTVWREASAQPIEAKLGVAWAIKNRTLKPGWYGSNYVSVVLKKAQFTSMVPPDGVDDPNLKRYPLPTDQSWKDTLKVCADVIQSNMPDPTGGSTYYYDKSEDRNPPAWAKDFIHMCDIGAFHFYKPPAGVI